jgi:tetratricopeptide (TPR) repeat protein
VRPYADLEIRLRRHTTAPSGATVVDGVAAAGAPDQVAAYDAEVSYRQSTDGDVKQLVGDPPARVCLDFSALREWKLSPDEYGARLTAMLFADERLRDAVAGARSRAANLPLRLRLRLDAEDDQVHAVAWEMLREPDPARLPRGAQGSGFLCFSRRVWLSRYTESADLTAVVRRPRGRLSALVVVANPAGLKDFGLTTVDTGAEIEHARKALRGISLTVLAREHSGKAATLPAIVAALDEGPDILYLVCHGTARRGEPVLFLEDDEGAVKRVLSAELVGHMMNLPRRPTLVVLAACQSAGRTHDRGSLAALGPRLAAGGVGAVVAMQEDVTVRTFDRFMPEFFRVLRRDGQIDDAMAAGRMAVQGRGDWWVPVLLLRLQDGRLWTETGGGRPWLLPVLSLAAALATVTVLAWLALVTFVPAEMTGTFNVAVAEFGELDAGGDVRASETGRTLSSWLFRSLVREHADLPSGQVGDVWHDDLGWWRKRVPIGVVTGRTPDERQDAAAALARRLNAHMVVYGHLTTTAAGRVLVPQFYVERLRGEAEEITGSHRLGAEIRLPEPFDPRDLHGPLNGELVLRARALLLFADGLAYAVAYGDHAEAYRRFVAAEAKLPGWRLGREVLYLFQGREARQAHQLSDAEQAFRKAIEAQPGYARAHIGMGNVHLERAGCAAPGSAFDAAEWERASAAYGAALEVAPQASERRNVANAHLGLGAAYQCLAETRRLAGTPADEVVPLLRVAVSRSGEALAAAQTQDVRQIAQAHLLRGTAYSTMAGVRLQQLDGAGAREALASAGEAYDQCLAVVERHAASQKAQHKPVDLYLLETSKPKCEEYLGRVKQALAVL